uniref:Protein TRACHEARY ELEMENT DIFFERENTIATION-RELATED 6 n=1 Tax=Zinnia elegans TaxID=34245 RepID=TED6_ZINEL|nr:RecName: Full=Protein TRACHEARY ELEMENT DIFFERENTIATION-RELATED 6 [Zinnia elegans]BAH57853.1 tracheary element differentiation-related 6 [Zinnia elegans]
MATIFIVFVSFGCVFVLGIAAFVLCCLIKKWKCSKAIEKNEMVHVDQHLQVHENILQGPNGMKTVAITVDDDLHVHDEEECVKNEKLGTASTSKA